MKKRMMAAVPKASVIITNPTHYAVALSYERGMSAPICGRQRASIPSRSRSGKSPAARHPDRRERGRWREPCMRPSRSTTRFRWNIIHAVAEIIGYVMGLKRGLSGRQA